MCLARSPGRFAVLVLLLLALPPRAARSFCGFYVASGDAKLFNKASQVALVRDGDRTVLTMASDFRGEPREFALVVPVPTVLERDQIHVAERGLMERLDQFSAPRLVEYWDPPPCQRVVMQSEEISVRAGASAPMLSSKVSRSDGVTIEARYTVGEYDILILSATQSRGLHQWLTQHHYRVPAGAARVMDIYLKQGMKFFVAKVNLAEQQKLGFSYLRPLQMAYESPKFMLPVRLGLANADGPQELFVYTITRQGRVEPVNYRNVKLPTNSEVPELVKERFADFYRDLFSTQVRRHGMGVVFTEHAWDMTWCDPCAGSPLSPEELRSLGVWWADGARANPVFLTRLHARYDRTSFPEDLVLQVTQDRANFQGRYVVRHEWQGTETCEGVETYRAGLPKRRENQARTLAELTGWPLDRIRTQMAVSESWTRPGEHGKWWNSIWSK